MEQFEREVVSDLDEQTDDRAAARGRVPLHVRILLGLAAGAALGSAAREVLGPDSPLLASAIRHVAEPVGQLFLRSLLMTVVPLVVSSLVVGVAGIGDVRRLGRVGVRTVGFCLVISLVSVGLGILLANTVRPGMRLDPETRDLLMAEYADASKQAAPAPATGESPLMSFVAHARAGQSPRIDGAIDARHDRHHVLLDRVRRGADAGGRRDRGSGDRGARRRVQGDREGHRHRDEGGADRRRLPAVHDDCAVRVRVSHQPGLVRGHGAGGLAIHTFVVYPIALKLAARVSPVEFFKRIRTVMLTAFSTSSSNATLPTALRVSELNLGVPREIGAFVLTVGATANQNGTALYEGVTVLFLAQLAGVDLTLAQQMMIVYLAVLGSVGTAGVPSGSTPFVVAVLVTIGINPALIAIIIGVDRLLDMCRTVVNVVGDLAATVYVAKKEGATLQYLSGLPTEAHSLRADLQPKLGGQFSVSEGWGE